MHSMGPGSQRYTSPKSSHASHPPPRSFPLNADLLVPYPNLIPPPLFPLPSTSPTHQQVPSLPFPFPNQAPPPIPIPTFTPNHTPQINPRPSPSNKIPSNSIHTHHHHHHICPRNPVPHTPPPQKLCPRPHPLRPRPYPQATRTPRTRMA